MKWGAGRFRGLKMARALLGKELRALTRLLIGSLLMSVSLSLQSCTDRGAGTTKLCGEFRSYETKDEAQVSLRQRSDAKAWKEEIKASDPKDRREHFQFTTLSGPFDLFGSTGQLKLVFYNNRLMSAEFSPKNPDEFLARLRKQGEAVPTRAQEEITTDRRTRVEYYVDPDRSMRFMWSDPKLEDEWQQWVTNNS
jgi:hypothetical protein